MKQGRATALALALTLMLGQATEATLSIVKRDRLDLNWYFRNTSTKYTATGVFHGYYRDYNNDGLPDFLCVLRDPVNQDWRLFTLNTAPTGLEKVYPTHRTAGRDINHQLGVFVPDILHMPFAPSMDSPDLVVVGTDSATTSSSSPFTRFIFWRLNKTNPAWPTEATWSIDVASSYSPQVYWPSVSFNGDDYPDYMIYNSQANPNRQFVVSCYDGRNGSPIWSRPLLLDPQDPGTGIEMTAGGYLAKPYLSVSVLSDLPEHGAGGDFDANGKPEVFLFYTFGRGAVFTSYSMTTDINMLNSSGNFLAPYTASWTRIREVAATFSYPAPIIISDYSRDKYVDLLLLYYGMGTPTPPVFQAYSLKTRQFLFEALNSDFGPLPVDVQEYFALDQHNYFFYHPADISGDGWSDLNVYRSFGSPTAPLRVGMFHAYAGGGAQKGRKIWLQQFDNFNRAHNNVNDFDGDRLLDYILLRDPDLPDSPTVGQVTWRVAHTAVSASRIALGKQFDYSVPHSFAWNPALDDFTANSIMFSRFGDVDGDGMRDTVGTAAFGFDAGSNRTWDLAYGCVLIYDNTPGLAPPDPTAELIFQVQAENWIPYPVLTYAYSWANQSFVDNNRDGFVNDVVIDLEKAVFSMSLQYDIIGGPPTVEKATLSDLDGNGVDAGDHLALSLSRGVVVTTSVLRASHFFLPVQGDSLGGTGFRVSVNPFNARQIVLTLGQNPRLTPTGIFSMTARTSGSPSGIDFATSLPAGAIRSFDGISAIDGGAAGVNDSGIDVQFNLIAQSRSIGQLGGTLAVMDSPDAAYRQHRLSVPANALTTSITFTLSRPAQNLGAPGAMRVIASNPNVTFIRPATITLEYHDNDIDWDSGYIEGEMRVHQLVENPSGVFRFVPLPGRHVIQSVLGRGPAGVRKLSNGTNQVSVGTGNLNPGNSLGTSGIFAGLPVETVDERTIDIEPSGGGVVKGAPAVLTAGSQGAYTLHQIEIPGYETTTASDPDRLTVNMRTATMAERYSLAGGRSFPMQSGAIFVVTVTNALGQPVQLAAPANVTVQFKERSDPALTDVITFGGQRVLPANMRIVRDLTDGTDVDFGFINSPSESVNAALGTVTVPNLSGLTGSDGMGVFGAVAPAGGTPTAHWRLYR